jgi:hypothetical protein
MEDSLLGAPTPPLPLESNPKFGWWRFVHAYSFLTGGVTFLIGTWVLEPFTSDDAAQSNSLAGLSSALYTLGSLGFLLVDVLEFFTFPNALLRVNIALSMLGSAFYVSGSRGFAPAVAGAAPALGSLGFLVGSALIAGSQAWKVARLRAAPAQPPPHPPADAPLALGVEAGAGAGATFFLAGTALYWLRGWTAGPGYACVLWLWAVGSAAFTAGGACLWLRHYRLGLA